MCQPSKEWLPPLATLEKITGRSVFLLRQKKRPRSLGAVSFLERGFLVLGAFRPLHERAVRVDDVVVEVRRGAAVDRAVDGAVAARRADRVVVRRRVERVR